MARNKSPEALVSFLNEFFSMIDDLVDTYELEKIKTIGDCCILKRNKNEITRTNYESEITKRK